jgi:mono/diheme cytochrome c family protein
VEVKLSNSQTPAAKSRRTRFIVGLIAVVGLLAFGVWYNFFRVVAVTFDSPAEEFKYGSIGAEAPTGVPYWIWMVLPRMFPEKLPGPGGYVALGASWEEGHELPIGFSKMTIGFSRVGMNCAGCHTTSVRTNPKDQPTFYLGGPSSRFRSQDYARFLFACAKDPRFNSDDMMKEIAYLYRLSWTDSFLYRYILIPQTKRLLLKAEKEDYYWMPERPDWGPGRTDMNPFQRQVMRLPDDHSIGSTDVMPIWKERLHESMLHHSDGLNTTLVESSRSAALAAGANNRSINIAGINRIQAWLLDLPSPKYPYSINAEYAAKGKHIYDAQCASCHSFGGAKMGTVIPVTELGTDRHRVDHWPQSSADAFNRYAADYPWAFHHFRSSNGYVAYPLDGLWLRAPYLHNGSVPTLVDLLKPPESRPSVFYRGYDVYDQQNVGFISSGAEAQQEGFRYDTSVPGNANQGHLYGTSLAPADKRDLIEHLKTF